MISTSRHTITVLLRLSAMLRLCARMCVLAKYARLNNNMPLPRDLKVLIFNKFFMWKTPSLVLKLCYKLIILKSMQPRLARNCTECDDNKGYKVTSTVFLPTARSPTSICYIVFTPSTYKVYLPASSNHRTPVASSIPARAVVSSCGN